MRSIHLDGRLSAAAQLVRPGGVLADVGTDHGYLPAYLVQSGRILRAVASDVKEGPLQSARETVERCGLQERVELILSDGLANVPVEQVTDICIAGMGGELICRIIGDCPALQDPAKRLILQPMTNAGTVRRYLYENGFQILEERAVIDGPYTYCVLLACFTGTPQKIDDLVEWVGKMPMNLDGDSREYILRQQQRADQIAQGLRRSKDKGEKAAYYEDLARRIGECLPGQNGGKVESI